MTRTVEIPIGALTRTFLSINDQLITRLVIRSSLGIRRFSSVTMMYSYEVNNPTKSFNFNSPGLIDRSIRRIKPLTTETTLKSKPMPTPIAPPKLRMMRYQNQLRKAPESDDNEKFNQLDNRTAKMVANLAVVLSFSTKELIKVVTHSKGSRTISPLIKLSRKFFTKPNAISSRRSIVAVKIPAL